MKANNNNKRNNVTFGMIVSGLGKKQVFRDRRDRRPLEQKRKNIQEQL